jgi:pimeloyl-ACP methyl ester carboxylesterase
MHDTTQRRMRRPSRTFRVCLLGGLCFMLLVAISSAQAQQRPRAAFAGKLVACRVAGVEPEVLCGKREVLENRAAGTGRTIALNIVVLPATTDSVVDDAVVFLAGGGVVPATRYARFLSTAMPELRQHRDIVLVDQRGTGGSNPLTCDRASLDTATGLPPDERYLRYIAACRASLAMRADVRFYTTSLAMQDLDDVRSWLGYRALDLYSASYGTSAAATYVRRYPDRVRTVVMHGVVPLDVPMQLDLARSAQQTLDDVLERCAADAACRAAYPDVRAELARVMAGDAPQPFREALNSALAAVPSMRQVPMMIHDAAVGTAPPPEPPPGGAPAPLGVRLAILCSEGLSHVDTAAIASATAGTFLGDFPVRFQLRWCNGWPTAPLPPDFRTPFRSATPALLLTGELDPVTPPAYADRVRGWFTNGTVLRLPHRSHSDTDPCVSGLIEAFIVSGGARPDASCLTATPSLSFRVQR